MNQRFRIVVSLGLVLAGVIACTPGEKRIGLDAASGKAFAPVAIYQNVSDLSLGEPIGIAVDLHGDMFIADGLPGRILFINSIGNSGSEFQKPFRNPGFYPSDLKLHGFFLYAVDEVGRTLLRFDKDGAYRDLLLNFNEEIIGRRVSPYGLDVDPTGRVAVTDVENHRILVFDSYLSLEVVFGNYGSYPGQLDTPEGVSFAGTGDLVVADSGNKRIQFFGESGELLSVLPAEGGGNPLQRPRRAVVDDEGRTYVADPQAGRLFVFDKAGRLQESLYPEGAADFSPTDVEVTRTGLLYVTDTANRSLFVFKVMSY
ncbi:MAG: hypothetical protein GTO51_04095 [Candidatus Latescibacteria bacterium]|nr:hypothetical protein [Candidatus Latescibacterota bacterium]NIM21021.1 hypothetical protein [Candidatus Latescibacterota bacterium]NIM65156.1 hypothetical protein [Candidatus Latescibacterota bacterium]NIO01671.1 hypothetical protein [Candidatus Latescibacterota bacterium]NIO28188.1 hypothetical protein [Candidatus Latescibacterota bacterium]